MIDMENPGTFLAAWQRCVEESPLSDFLVYESHEEVRCESYTYADFDRYAGAVAALLCERGIGFGDRFAVLESNTPEFVAFLLAAMKIGAILVPLNPSYTREECSYIVDVCECKLLVVRAGLEEGITGLVPPGDPLLVSENFGADLLERCERGDLLPLPPREAGGEEVVEIMFTSGTTAAPKGVMLTQANFAFSGAYVAWELSMSSKDRYLTTMSASHVNFQLSAFTPVVWSQACLILIKHYSASRFIAQARRHRATLAQGMAMILRTLLKQPPSPEDSQHDLRDIHYFLPVKESEKRAFEERFGVGLLNNYGSTESLVGAITDFPGQERHWPSIGKPGPGYDVKIVDGHGCEQPVNTCGEIWLHGKPGVSLMAGYWRNEEATARALDSQGWYHTGDWGYRDEEGWIYFVDRRSDLIKRAGENVSPSEVEEVLLAYPGVSEVVVLGVPDPIRDHAIKAVIVPESGLDLDVHTLRRHASEYLACFKIPTILEIRTSLPRGEYGKVLRDQLMNPPSALETVSGECRYFEF